MPTQHRGEFELLQIHSRITGLQNQTSADELNLLITSHPITGLIIFHLCLWTSASEACSRLVEPNPQWDIEPSTLYEYICVYMCVCTQNGQTGDT